ncbi:MAG TPA: hypothetical protein DHV02_05795 [Neisseriales bacterium]|nr:hypothetical protein [Neisseriales bacterium]
MKYRTKLYVALVITAIISTVISLSIIHFQAKKLLLEELHTNVVSIAVNAASEVDPKMIQQVQLNKNVNSLEYTATQNVLRKIRDNNRRENLFVKYIYIIDPAHNKPNQFNYLVDAEEKTSADFSPIGESADEAISADLSGHLKQIYSPANFVTDAWGEWMTGYAPIYTSDGKYLATVGVNLYASRIMTKLNKLVKDGFISLGATLLITLIIGWYLSHRQTLALKQLHNGVKAIGGGDLNHTISINTKDEFEDLATDINRMAQGLRERERLLISFTRYVSQHIMESILKSEDQIKLSGERRKVTVLFSDIRNFTTFSEKHDPEQVVLLLNEYFSAMVEIIFRNQGILDKFLGDGIMVEFGVPLDDPHQESNAVKTAIEMREEVARLCAKWASEGKPGIDIGIGIHTGFAVIGNIGSEKRVEYTAIGDAVNVAARIEQLTKELKTPILISETTVAAIREQFNFKALGPQAIRGRTETIDVYTLN